MKLSTIPRVLIPICLTAIIGLSACSDDITVEQYNNDVSYCQERKLQAYVSGRGFGDAVLAVRCKDQQGNTFPIPKVK